MRSAVILAPSHADSDVRVTRSIDAVRFLYDRTTVFWDDSYPGHRKRGFALEPSTTAHYLLPRSLWRWRALVGRSPFNVDEQKAIVDATLVYVHGSGIDGLLLCQSARRLSRRALVVFDYHDSLPFELAFQLSKRGAESAYPLLWRAHRVVLRRAATALDGLIGISEEQLEEALDILSRQLPTAAIPNLRPFGSSPGRLASVAGEPIELVWVGQVMRGRDLERVIRWVVDSSTDVGLSLHGHVLHQDVVAGARAVLGGRLRTAGVFEGDADLAARLRQRSVGVFMGWDDPMSTGINAIASPNKFFSYVNLGVPVIIDRRLTSLAKMLDRFNAGIAVTGQSEFAEALDLMTARYEHYETGMRQLRAHLATRDLQKELTVYLRELERRSQRTAE